MKGGLWDRDRGGAWGWWGVQSAIGRTLRPREHECSNTAAQPRRLVLVLRPRPWEGLWSL